MIRVDPVYVRDEEGRIIRDEDYDMVRKGNYTEHRVTTLYQHWDGYPEHRGVAICEFILKNERMLFDGFVPKYIYELTKDEQSPSMFEPHALGELEMGQEFEYEVYRCEDAKAEHPTWQVAVYRSPRWHHEEGKPKLLIIGIPEKVLEWSKHQ